MFGFSRHGHTLKSLVPTTQPPAGQRPFCVSGPMIYNSLPAHVKMSWTVKIIKTILKTYMLNLSSVGLDKMYLSFYGGENFVIAGFCTSSFSLDRFNLSMSLFLWDKKETMEFSNFGLVLFTLLSVSLFLRETPMNSIHYCYLII